MKKKIKRKHFYFSFEDTIFTVGSLEGKTFSQPVITGQKIPLNTVPISIDNNQKYSSEKWLE